MPHEAEQAVLDDAGINVSPNKPPFNLTAELQDLASGNVDGAAAGVLGRINSNATEFLNGLVVVTVRRTALPNLRLVQSTGRQSLLHACWAHPGACVQHTASER